VPTIFAPAAPLRPPGRPLVGLRVPGSDGLEIARREAQAELQKRHPGAHVEVDVNGGKNGGKNQVRPTAAALEGK
jgi:hypothetical protein